MMTIAAAATSRTGAASQEASRHALSTGMVRGLFLLVVCAAFTTGLLAIGAEAMSRAVSRAGVDLTRLLRGMAVLKAMMAAGATAAVLWRLGAPVKPLRFAAYAVACAAMWAGPGLIWSMARIGTGALLLHGGLLMCVVLLWRDPAVSARLAAMVTARRASLRAGELHGSQG